MKFRHELIMSHAWLCQQAQGKSTQNAHQFFELNLSDVASWHLVERHLHILDFLGYFYYTLGVTLILWPLVSHKEAYFLYTVKIVSIHSNVLKNLSFFIVLKREN
ncbi:hypothetical protein GDO86_002981 [Hymenochirus boettgeri]|uniref:Uncharacterized protein n=1 Tax=Hymenochirus boettgeri TaxID=247094 RepID=A0A8T2K7M1_9PIPI|nr:hypothetical protein GDO86_002981 [Hymenochirus boettgeri]